VFARHNSLRIVALTLLVGSSIANAEVVQFRSGQTGGVPGTPGSLDDIVTVNPWGNPGGAPVLGSPFLVTDFIATNGGPSAVVIQPVAPWMGGVTAPLSDPKARWINFAADAQGFGTAGSVLYAIPFWINTVNITSAIITFEGGADDMLGDWFYGGPNPDGFYVNGLNTGYQYVGFNFGAPTTHTQNITGMVNTGQNYLYYYQRDAGFGVSGIIFSGTIDVLPTPATASLLGAAGLVCLRRRR